MKLKQISVPIENSQERLVTLTRALGEKGITSRALTLVDTGNFGELRLLASDVVAARRILMQKDIPGRVEEVVAIEVEDRLDLLSQLIAQLMAADVKIKYSYPYAINHTGKTIMIFCFSDNDRAIKVLADREIQPLDYHSFGMLETAA